jgi:prepilin-type N-terminal cleavage/methylation domain-containing protein
VEALMRDERGFTLMETLVALFIMISAATLLYRGFASGLAAAGVADAQQTALAVAQSRLASLGAEIPLEAGRLEGVEDGGVAWTLEVRPYAADGGGQEARPQAFWATVTVSWRDRSAGPARSLHLTTLKLRGKR